MFKRRYLVWWRYSEHGHVFKSKLYDSYEEAKEFVAKHGFPWWHYDIEELLFEA